MADQERFNRDPTYDLVRHIAQGGKVPFSGDPLWSRRLDAELERGDPMDDWTRHPNQKDLTTPLDAAAVAAIDNAQNRDLGATMGLGGIEPVDMTKANDWSDEATKGLLAYGPANTGREGGKY